MKERVLNSAQTEKTVKYDPCSFCFFEPSLARERERLVDSFELGDK